jgi:hypothetical protein
LASNAVIALGACGEEGHNDFVTKGKAFHLITHFDNLANKFVSADEVRRAFQVATVEV